jgi:hypothetical protein
MKRSFLKNFSTQAWEVASDGRVARLTLKGCSGTLNIIPIYFDPVSADVQIKPVNFINQCLITHAHNLIGGDWNFVEHATDRIAKATATTAVTCDSRPAKIWGDIAQRWGFNEFEQDRYTCENSHGWSKIDRICTDLHKANLLNSVSHCSTMEHPRHLSDHCPVTFGVRSKRNTNADFIPNWVASHDNFEAEVQISLRFLKQQYIEDNSGKSPTPVDELCLLKSAIREASNAVRAGSAQKIAETTAHKLALTLSFIRLVESGNYSKAKSLQARYGKLCCGMSASTTRSAEFKDIKNHAVDLIHIDIDERARELNTMRHGLAEEVYKRRKWNCETS